VIQKIGRAHSDGSAATLEKLKLDSADVLPFIPPEYVIAVIC
jgi:hypothetical protein